MANATPNSNESIKVTVGFGGGLEILFNNQRSHSVSLPARVPSSTAKNSDPPTTTSVESIATSSSPAEADTDAESRPADVTALIEHLREHALTDKKRAGLFAENGTIRPGVLVLINDTDWEIEGEGSYVLKDGDDVSFISTLHGG